MPHLHAVMTQTGLPRAALTDEVAIVTGAGRGIGRAAARALGWLGARVIVAELDAASGSETAALIRDAGGAARFIATDVSDADQVAALVAATVEAFGPPGILINNAILCPVASVIEMEVATWDRVHAVNLRGAFLTCHAVLPHMVARGGGTIVNMVSTDAMPGLAAYIASKQGLVGFSQSLALEVGDQNVRVIAFGPGMVDTPGFRGVVPRLAPRLGLTEAQLLEVPLHAAYEGLMPVAHAGAATAYLIAALAGEYHGEVIDGYAVLERAGVIQPAMPLEDARPATAAEPAPAATSAEDALAAVRHRTSALQKMLEATAAEFEQLPLFARPLARRGFKAKAGRRLQDWARTVDDLAAELGAGRAPAHRIQLVADLDRLAAYYEGVPAETARFTKDAALLHEVAERTAARIAAIHELQTALAALD